MPKSFFIDTTRCMACKGCQVACKEWHDLPADQTKNIGSYQNPDDLSFTTYKLIRMTEEIVEGKLHWLFFQDQCRHCLDPSCLEAAYDPTAIFKDGRTGAVIYTPRTRGLNADDIQESCPYNIPRKGPDGTLSKCDMCNDRIQNGHAPVCVATCPTGSMNFGNRPDMIALAGKRLRQVQKKFPHATCLDTESVSVIFLVALNPVRYSQFAAAGAAGGDRTRKRMGSPQRFIKV